MSDNSGEETIETIYPDVRHPYYIVAPSYETTSAGVRVQHLLCHALNRKGFAAYILLFPALPFRRRHTAPDLMTPLLTADVVRSHFERGLTPIMLYPEVIPGNPFGGACVVRYVMNFPGLLGGDKDYAAEELCFSYSKVLAAETRSPDNVLFLPATDTSIFCLPPAGQKRQGSCFYGYKYQNAYGGRLQDITKNSFEITRDRRDSPTPRKIAEIFQRSEIFYAYENTALALEAALCGCPTVFLPSPYLTELIAARELGTDGFAWGAEAAEVARAKATVMQARRNYLSTYAAFWRDLDRFVALTQQHAEHRRHETPVRLPTVVDTLAFVLRRRGFLGALRKLRRMLTAIS